MKRTSEGTGSAGPAISRRRLLAGTGAVVATAVVEFPAIRTRAAGTLKVGTYGGYFKDSFDEHIYPAFTEETGIEIESIAEPTGEAWLATSPRPTSA
jgi:putative spermidine/putrescine transport system substrate-binding protein